VRLKNLDLIVTMIIAVMNVAWALLPGHSIIIGIILALPLVFVLPGYTLTVALFQKRALDTSHRLILSLGLSLAIDILSGLALNMLPAGLQALSWAWFLGLLTAVFSLLAAYLRRGVQLNGDRLLRPHFTFYVCYLFGLATIVAAVSVLYSAIGAAQRPHAGFTQFWMMPAAPSGNSCAVLLGVRSFELAPATYRITVAVNGAEVTTWSSVVLAPQEDWEASIPVAASTAENVSVEALLYRSDELRTVYRRVDVTLYSLGGSRSGKIHDIRAHSCSSSPNSLSNSGQFH
jgi:uncharacterized membrane protein